MVDWSERICKLKKNKNPGEKVKLDESEMKKGTRESKANFISASLIWYKGLQM